MRETGPGKRGERLPQMHSLNEMMKRVDPERGMTLVEPFTLTHDQMRLLLPDEPPLLEPIGLRSGIEMFPYPGGYVGLPFCQSSDPRVTCFPMGPGPDDDPRGFSCVCTGDFGQDDSGGLIPGDPEPVLEPCALKLELKGSQFGFRCVSQNCSGKCRLVRNLFGRLRFGCECN